MLPQPRTPAIVGPLRCCVLRIRCFLRRHPRWQTWLWTAIYALVALLGISAGVALGDEKSLRPLFDALWQAEASGQLHPDDGDSGRAIGAYQIWHIYWQSAIEFAPELGGTYQDCRDKTYAEFVILAHWLRFCPKAVENYDYRALAVTHHLGGSPEKRPKRAEWYWQKRIKPNLKGDGR